VEQETHMFLRSDDMVQTFLGARICWAEPIAFSFWSPYLITADVYLRVFIKGLSEMADLP
jgi:hypothetical protein